MVQNASKAFGKVIRQKRRELGLSQEKMGELSGLHRTYIGQLENGKKSPTLKTLFVLAKTLHIKPSELLREIEN
jgi:transcriptional regulator with XRE-family HTH domain